MDSFNVKECYINGIQYKCRTCFNPGATVCSLNGEFKNAKTRLDLLQDAGQLKISTHDDLLPQTMCCVCSEKLKISYDFLLQIRDVNRKFLKLLYKSEDPPQNGFDEQLSDFLNEPTIDLPTQEYISETKLEIEDDPILEHEENDKSILEKELIIFDPEHSDDYKQYEKSISMEDSYYGPSKRLKGENDSVENIDPPTKKRKGLRNLPDYYDKIKKINDRFVCFICQKSYSLRKNCGRHIASIHLRSKNFPCEFCSERFSGKNEKYAHIKRVHPYPFGSRLYSKPTKWHSDDYKQYEKSISMEDSYYGPSKRLKGENDSVENIDPPTKKRKGLDYYDKIEKINDRFVCFICQKSFPLRKSCGRHIASIHLRPKNFPCEFCGERFSGKNEKYAHIKRVHPYPFGSRLYSKPTKWQLVECKLCNTTFSTTKDLENHLLLHSSIDTLDNLDFNSQIIQHLFANTNDLNTIKESICRDIHEKQWFKYYNVLNEYSLEMSITDTDVEDLEDDAIQTSSKYKCELCNQQFSFKFQTFAHLKETHEEEEVPYRCGLCKTKFVSLKMFQHHTRTHCRNRHKMMVCPSCPAKFVWPDNLKNHNCVARVVVSSITDNNDYTCNICNRVFEELAKYEKHLECHKYSNIVSNKAIIKCGLCIKSFEKISQLREHMPVHADGKTGIDFRNSIYVNIFERSKTLDFGLLQLEIKKAYRRSQIGRYYCALDKNGYEMDILDSDSAEEDSEVFNKQKIKKEYKCELCSEIYERRKLLLNHQFEMHNDVPMPYTCNSCTQQYVSNDLLQQHLVRDCWNEHRRVATQCEFCKARFIWPNNLFKHKKMQHKHQKNPRPEIVRTLKCEFCEKVFMWHKDLVRHRKIHTEVKRLPCPHCGREFIRKDCLLSHMRIHNATTLSITLNSNRTLDYILPHLLKPHGCKQIKCMICYSEHYRIRDLHSHLRSHRYNINFEKRKETETLDTISAQLYPDETVMCEEDLIKRIGTDIAAENNMERFYSITNENGCEVNLDSSETETDTSDNEEDNSKEDKLQCHYTCDLCPSLNFNRKFKLFKHHNENHTWEEAPHVCMHCNGRFLSNHMLQLHYRSQCKNTIKRYFCRRCPLVFMWENNLQLHFIMEHGQETDPIRRIACIICQEKFANQWEIKRHMSQSHCNDDDVHYCLFCPRTFYNIAHLNEHLTRHPITEVDIQTAEVILNSTCWPNSDKIIKCKLCGQTFDTMANLKEHFSSLYPQNLCATQHSLANYSITNQKGFELHLEMDSESEMEDEIDTGGQQKLHPYTCYLCDVSYRRKYQMAQHQRSMHNYQDLALKCERCIFRTVCQKILDYHQSTQCFNEEKQYECRDCKFKFMWQENLNNHVSIFHPPKDKCPKEENIIKTKITNKIAQQANSIVPYVFECMACRRHFANKADYKMHFKNTHFSDNQLTTGSNTKSTKNTTLKTENKHLCAFCGMPFPYHSQLMIHMHRHSGEKSVKA